MQKLIAYLISNLCEGGEINIISYIKEVGVENRFAFNNQFKSDVMGILSFGFDNGYKGVIQWAQTTVDNQFEIFERLEVLKYWTNIEAKKLEMNMEYQALVHLNYKSTIECNLITRSEAISDGNLARKRRYSPNSPSRNTKRKTEGDDIKKEDSEISEDDENSESSDTTEDSYNQ